MNKDCMELRAKPRRRLLWGDRKEHAEQKQGRSRHSLRRARYHRGHLQREDRISSRKGEAEVPGAVQRSNKIRTERSLLVLAIRRHLVTLEH